MDLEEYNFLLELFATFEEYDMDVELEMNGFELSVRNHVEKCLASMVVNRKKPNLTLVKKEP